jgi:hypothetical protein
LRNKIIVSALADNFYTHFQHPGKSDAVPSESPMYAMLCIHV